MSLYLLTGLGIVALAVVLVFTHWSRLRLRDEISAAESRVSRRVVLLQGRVAALSATVQRLEFERRNARGEIRFEASMTLDDAYAVHPRVREIFAAFGLGASGCSGGGAPDASRTIAETCGEASLDVDSVLAALRTFLRDPDGPLQTEPASARLHRIQLVPPPRDPASRKP
ncbi:hypothetical protein K8I85_04955 [bacterium]|nr:hypothetical protein [bacterium]